MLLKRPLGETRPAEADTSLWVNPRSVTAGVEFDALANQPMCRNGLFKRKAEQRDYARTGQSDKYPFKWTVLGLVLFCSAFWVALFWLFFR